MWYYMETSSTMFIAEIILRWIKPVTLHYCIVSVGCLNHSSSFRTSSSMHSWLYVHPLFCMMLAWDRKLRTSSPQRHYHAQCRYELRQQTMTHWSKGFLDAHTIGIVQSSLLNGHEPKVTIVQKQSRSKSHTTSEIVVTVLTFLSFSNSLS